MHVLHLMQSFAHLICIVSGSSCRKWILNTGPEKCTNVDRITRINSNSLLYQQPPTWEVSKAIVVWQFCHFDKHAKMTKFCHFCMLVKTTKLSIRHYSDKLQIWTLMRFWNHEIYPIAHPRGWAMRCFCGCLGENYILQWDIIISLKNNNLNGGE